MPDKCPPFTTTVFAPISRIRFAASFISPTESTAMPVKAAASAVLGVTIDASRISRLFKSKTPSGFRRITDPSLVAVITGSTTTCGESIRASASHTMP